MSEYQYYEFQAIDRPLTEQETDELRQYSTRAHITPTSFINHYQWGSFKGNPDQWMEKYFDVFFYFANWGTRELKLRFPSTLLVPAIVGQYCNGRSASARAKNGKVVLSFSGGNEDFEWDDEPRLSTLLAVRSELASGDLRALYIGWLLLVQHGELSEDDLEPPVPPGLNELSAALHGLADFLCIDFDLLHAAAQASAPLRHDEPGHDEAFRWIAQLTTAEKDALLTRLMIEDSRTGISELRQRYRKEHSAATELQAPQRTVRELLKSAETAAEDRQRIETEKRKREKARKEREAALAREIHLNGIAGREPELWNRIESLLATKQPKSYDMAVNLLVDLRELDLRGKQNAFPARLQSLRHAHVNKTSFLRWLREQGL